MEIDHFQHRCDVTFGHRLWNTSAMGVSVTGERPQHFGHSRALFISFAGHDRCDRAAKGPAFGAVVSVTVAHDERTEIGVTETESPENMRILRDLFDRITRVIDHDFLRSNEDADRR